MENIIGVKMGELMREKGITASALSAKLEEFGVKLSERELLRRDTGEEPVLLLDDVLSELDATRQDFVLNQITSGQVLITCCEPGRVTKIGKTIEIRAGGLVCT